MQKELFDLIDQIEDTDNIVIVKDLLENYLKEAPQKNILGRRLTSIVNEFIDEIKGKKDKTRLADKKTRLIKLILDLEIKDLELVEKIYNACGYPFPYKGKHLSDLYDENLRIFIEEDVYREYMADTFESEEVKTYNNIRNKTGEFIQSNLEKYKRSFIRYVNVYLDNQEAENDEYEQMVIRLFRKMYFEDSEFVDKVFSESDFCEDFEWMYDRSSNEILKDNKDIPLETFRNVILLGLMENVCLPAGKKIRNIFRNTLDSKKSYVKDILFDIVNYDDYYSYDFFKTNYNKLFIENNKEENHALFINYFTDVLMNLKREMKEFVLLRKLTKKDLRLLVEDYKITIDA